MSDLPRRRPVTTGGPGGSAPDGDVAFPLAVCAEMVFLDLPRTERVRRIDALGFQVEIWNHAAHDIDALAGTGATFSSMTGYVHGSLVDEAGADVLVRTAADCIAVATRLGCPRLNLHGTELGVDGLPVVPVDSTTDAMWRTACRTLARLAQLAERHGVVFCLENLNTALDHPGVPFASVGDTMALVAAVDHPAMRLMLDLYHAEVGEAGGAARGSGDAHERTTDLIDLVRRAGHLIGEIQVADVPGRCEPGTGQIDYAAVAGTLVDSGYRGTVGLEAWASGDTELALRRFRDVFTVR